MNVLSNLDLNFNEIRNVVLHKTTDLTTSYSGTIFFDTADNIVKYWNGTTWIPLPGVSLSVGAATSTIQTTGSFTALTALSYSNGAFSATNTTYTLPANLVGLAGLTSQSNGLPMRASDGTWSLVDVSSVGSGTVTSVATSNGLSGGPITTSGTISLTNSSAVSDNKGYAIQLRDCSLTNHGGLLQKSTFTFNPSTNTLASVVLGNGTTATTQSAGDNSTKVATTAYTDAAITALNNNIQGDISNLQSQIDNLPSPMIFKGSVGTGGTVTWANLPEAAAANTGFTYKVITAHATAPICEIGDTIVSDGTQWVVIPSGDEPSGTVTSVGVSVPTGLSVSGSPVTSSGTIAISLANGYTIPTTTDIDQIGTNASDITSLKNRFEIARLLGDGVTQIFSISNDFGTNAVICQVYDVSGNLVVVDINVTSSTITVSFGHAPANGVNYNLHLISMVE